jgi:FtsP/CotA-like multicopper oxidase with cupredoxin domain/peroxiredoxin
MKAAMANDRQRRGQAAVIAFLAAFQATVLLAGQDVAPAPRGIVATNLQTSRELASKMNVPFRNPLVAQKLHGQNTFLLCLSKATFYSPLANQVDSNVPGAFELLCYNHLPVGPTIRVHRGETFYIHLMNLLDPDPANVVYPQGAAHAEHPQNLGSTNLHTHGLHVSPDADSDNIFVSVDPLDPSKPIDPDKGPCNEHVFRYAVSDDHPAGTFWYHPHRHGSVAYQLANGLAGALIVDGDPHFNKGFRDLESIPEIAAASEHDPKDPSHNHERVIVIQMYNYRRAADGVGRIDAQQLYNYYFDDSSAKPDPKSSSSISVTGAPGPTVWAINGVINPEFTIAPGEVQRWRFIYTGHDTVQPLMLADSTGAKATDVQFQEIALDGIATGTMTPQTELDIAPGQRSDDLIRCPDNPKDTTYYLMQTPSRAGLTTRGKRIEKLQYLAKLTVKGNPQHMQLPDLGDTHVRRRFEECQPFHSLAGAVVSQPSIPNGKLTFFGQDPPDQAHLDASTYTIDDKTFHEQDPVKIEVGHAEEWLLSSGNPSDGHPFHIHVNPFQVLCSRNIATGAVTNYKNLWRDTQFLEPGFEYKIRTYFKPDCVGDTVLHCHILDHEDQGMMMCLRFVDPTGKLSALGPGCPPSELKPVNAPAPPVRLPNASGAMQQIEFKSGRPTVLVFFRGMECPACVAQLRQIIGMLHGPSGNSADVIAVSSQPINDAAAALNGLGVTPTDHVIVLIDNEHNTFQKYECVQASEPQHGLFLIDGIGVIHQRYVGASPYRDMESLVKQLTLLAPAPKTNLQSLTK